MPDGQTMRDGVTDKKSIVSLTDAIRPAYGDEVSE